MIPKLDRIEAILPMNAEEWLSYSVDEPFTNEKSSLAILCHGLTGDKVGPQKLLITLASQLAQHNIRTIRFDFRGSGLSSGCFLDTSFLSMKEDLLFIINSLRKKYKACCIHLLGVSTGSLIPVLLASEITDCASVTLISNGCPEEISFVMEEGDTITLRDGQLFLKRSYFEERIYMKPRSQYLSKIKATVSFVLGTLDLKHYEHADESEKQGYHVFRIPDGDHLFTDSKIRKLVANTVCQIIEKSNLKQEPSK